MPTENNKTKLDDTKIPLHNSPTHTTTSTTTKKKDKKQQKRTHDTTQILRTIKCNPKTRITEYKYQV